MVTPRIAFATPEIAIHPELPTYEGGLGYLAGSALRSALELNIPMIGVTILPTQVYVQDIDSKGMVVRYVDMNYEDVLELTGVDLTIHIDRSPVKIGAYYLPEGRFGSVPIYLLTTNVGGNDELARMNTIQLYGGTLESGANSRRKIAQSLVLAKGTIEIMHILGAKDPLYHVNESHGAFIGIDLLHRFINQGLSFEDALRETRKRVRFTTHTPVDAGNPRYPMEDVVEITGYRRDILERCGGNPFDMAGAGMRTALRSIAVSKKHAETVQYLWRGNPDLERLSYVTNGVDKSFWQCPEFERAKNPDQVARAKVPYKQKMLGFVRHQKRRYWSECIPTGVYAKRWTGYKRPDLITYDMQWLEEHLRRTSFQLIFAGRPHPDERPMIDAWNRIHELSKHLPNLVILPGYNLELSKLLKAGADFWLNNPRVGCEACGTSGMSAAMNCAINVSTIDGWMCEANMKNFFPFGSLHIIDVNQDVFDAKALRETIDNSVLPLYYRKHDWYEMALRAKREAETHWTSRRMMLEYIDKLYAGEDGVSEFNLSEVAA